MSEILRPQLQNIFSSYSFSSQQYASSFGTPVQDRLTSVLQDRGLPSSSRVRYENLNTRPSLSNSHGKASFLSLSSAIPLEKSQISSITSISRRESITSASQGPYLPHKAPQHRGMKTLVLDLDETLIHASTVPESRPDSIVRLADGTRFYILKRPYLEEFLEQMSKIYELVIYTAGEQDF